MEISTTLPRKYFVVVTHSTTSQRELESILSSKRFNSFGTSQAQMFIEDTPPGTGGVLIHQREQEERRPSYRT